MKIEPIILEGNHVRLEPVRLDHCDALWKAGSNPSIWTYIPFPMRSVDDMRRRVEGAIAELNRGTALWFATIHRATETPIGCTGFWSVDTYHRRVEIGGTWITPEHQRSATNTEAKLLMLTHCFEVYGCIRVEFKTDSLNSRSRAALARIGATEEGTFRNHMIMPDGRYRHSVYFSITDTEWPTVKARLQERLQHTT